MDSDILAAFSRSVYTLPAVCLLASAPWSIYEETRKARVTRGVDSLLRMKMITAAAHCLVEVLTHATRLGALPLLQMTALTMESLDIWAAICLGLLFVIYHKTQTSPSTGISIYLAVDIMLKGLFCWSKNQAAMPGLFKAFASFGLMLKLSLLILHETSKWDAIPTKTRQTMHRGESVGFWTDALGLWVFKALFDADHRTLRQEDLWTIPSKTSSQTLNHLFRLFWKEGAQERSLFNSCIAACQWSFLLTTFVNLLISGIKFTFPFVVESFIEHLDRCQQDDSISRLDPQTIGISLQIAMLLLGFTIAKSYSTSINNSAEIMTRGMVTSAIFEKIFALSDHDLTENVDSSLLIDSVAQVQKSYNILQEGISSYIDSFLCLYLLWDYFGYRTVLSVLSIAVAIVIFNRLGSLLAKSCQNWATDAQTRASETIRSIRILKSIKMANRIDVISFNITSLFKAEIKSRTVYYYLAAAYFGLLVSTNSVVPVVAINSTTLQSTQAKFIMIRCLTLLYWFADDIRILLQFPRDWSATSAAFTRIQKFLNLSTNEERKRRFIRAGHTNTSDTDPAQQVLPPVQICNATITPSTTSLPVIKGANMSLPYGSLSVIAGDVGSGKTTLLRGISGRAPVVSGSITISGDVFGYCGQDIWLQNKSIRENIIGPSEFRRPWFNVVLQACMIEDEARRLGEGYIIGPHGANLNRSQRQRLALARAVYSKAPVLLLDDVLSSQSPHMASSLIANLFSRTGVLRRGTTVIMVTLKPELFYEICDQFFKVETDGRVSHINVASLPTPAVPQPSTTTSDNAEQMEEPVVAEAVTKLQEFSKDIASGLRPRPLLTDNLETGTYSVFCKYLRSSTAMVCISLLICTVILENFPHIFLRIWASTTTSKPFPDALVYATTALSGPFFAFSAISFQCLLHSGLSTIHEEMLQATLKSTISALTPKKAGLAINLFTEGLRIISHDLPLSAFRLLYINTAVVMFFLVLLSANAWTLALAPCVIWAFCSVRSLYRMLSLQLHHMELNCSENVYSEFDEIVSGLAHLESFDWIENRSTQVHNILEHSQQVYCHYLALKRWLSMVSDLFGAVFTGIYVVVVSSRSTDPFNAGIGLSLCLYIKLAIGYTIENLTNLDTSAIVLEQMQEFMRDTPQEPEQPLTRIEGEWPSRCLIEFENVSIGYNLPNSPPLISGINLRIFGREAALCGTFNSGKTTFLLSMVAWLPYTGSIKIDGIEARTIPREQFNSVFTVVPQDPILFHNTTIRKNLLPDEIMELQDQEGCEVVLERILAGVGLSAIVERNGGILSQFSTLKLSYEQNQRFSLAQGLVQYFFNPTKMALIDGVTDNVSNEGLDRMTSMMREMFQFGECSIISTTNRPPSHITAPWLAQITRPVPTGMTLAN